MSPNIPPLVMMVACWLLSWLYARRAFRVLNGWRYGYAARSANLFLFGVFYIWLWWEHPGNDQASFWARVFTLTLFFDMAFENVNVLAPNLMDHIDAVCRRILNAWKRLSTMGR